MTGFVSGNGATFGGITSAFTYNKRLQPVNMSASSPSQTVFSIGYDFHVGNGTAGSGADNGNVWKIYNYRDRTRDQNFNYDQLNRLTSAQNAGTNCAASTVNGKTDGEQAVKMQPDQSGNIFVQLRDGVPAVQKRVEVILDLNAHGNWIHGIEMLGGLLDFSLQQALKPFNPRMPALGEDRDPQKLKVTYDPEANAAYFYLPYGRRFQSLSSNGRQEIAKYSHSITPTATVQLDADGGLLTFSVPTADAIGSLDDFLYLFDASFPLLAPNKPQQH